jgi:hypothetical protein
MDILVSTVIIYGVENRDSNPSRGKDFSLRHHIQTGFLAHHSPVQGELKVSSLKANWTAREADNSAPSSA